MIFLHSRPKQLANHLRDCIMRGELTEPLPGIREWHKLLGVSFETLRISLRMLQREGLLIIHPRKVIQLKKSRRLVVKHKSGHRPVVRILYYGREYPNVSLRELPGLTEYLQTCGINLTLEKCTHARLKSLSQNPLPAHEMLFLSSVPASYHRYFAHMSHNVLIVGHPCPNSPLSYITVDLEGAICHATQSLMRRGFSTISFLINRGKSQGVLKAIEVFHRTCTNWPHQPIHANTVQIHTDLDSMFLAARRFALRVKTRQAILVVEPIPVSMIMTALHERGISIPRDVEIIAINTSPDSVKVCPRPIHYPYPLRALVRNFSDAAIHFFDTGALPRIRKVLLMEAVPAAL